jgi:hypothetical protein
MRGNSPVSFGKGVTEKAREGPRRYPTSFGEGMSEKGLQWYLVGILLYNMLRKGQIESVDKRESMKQVAFIASLFEVAV